FELEALRRKATLGEAPLGDVFDRQQDDVRQNLRVRHEPSVDHHDLPANVGEDVVDLDVVQLAFGVKTVAQQLSQTRDVPLAIAQRKQHFADRDVGRDAKGLKKRSVGVRDAKVRVEDKERLTHCIDDIHQ